MLGEVIEAGLYLATGGAGYQMYLWYREGKVKRKTLVVSNDETASRELEASLLAESDRLFDKLMAELDADIAKRDAILNPPPPPSPVMVYQPLTAARGLDDIVARRVSYLQAAEHDQTVLSTLQDGPIRTVVSVCDSPDCNYCDRGPKVDVARYADARAKLLQADVLWYDDEVPYQ